MFEDLLAAVEPATKRALGAYLFRLAQHLTAEADLAEDAARVNDRRRARAREARRAAGAVDALVLKGAEPEAAIAEIAGRLALDPAQLRAWWHAGRATPRGKRQLRDIEIMRLAAKGWSNAEIRARCKVSDSTITRIVRRLARAGAPGHQAAAARIAAAKNSAGESLSPILPAADEKEGNDGRCMEEIASRGSAALLPRLAGGGR